jgi:hypothetical protein
MDFFWHLSSGYSCSIYLYTDTHLHHTHTIFTPPRTQPDLQLYTDMKIRPWSLERSPEALRLCRGRAHRNPFVALHALRGSTQILLWGHAPMRNASDPGIELASSRQHTSDTTARAGARSLHVWIRELARLHLYPQKVPRLAHPHNKIGNTPCTVLGFSKHVVTCTCPYTDRTWYIRPPL